MVGILISLSRNRHIWCIEICFALPFANWKVMRNRHIWCIEICLKCIGLCEEILAEPAHLMYWNLTFGPVVSWIIVAEPAHLMYWNLVLRQLFESAYIAEPAHLMYWNLIGSPVSESRPSGTGTFDVLKSKNKVSTIEFQLAEPAHLMYWNMFWVVCHANTCSRNRHIWCIEITKIGLLRELLDKAEPAHLMYWNITSSYGNATDGSAEPAHLMYWNRRWQ